MGRPPEGPDDLDYRYVSFSRRTADLIWKTAAAAVFAALAATLVVPRRRGSPVSAYEVSSVFLASHLLAGITWKAHLVSLIFVFMTFFCADYRVFGRARGLVMAVVLTLIVSTPFAGRMFVGEGIHMMLGGYGTIAWSLVLFYVLTIRLSLGGSGPGLRPEARRREP